MSYKAGNFYRAQSVVGEVFEVKQAQNNEIVVKDKCNSEAPKPQSDFSFLRILLSLSLLAICHQSSASSCRFFTDPFFGYTCELTDASVTQPNENLIINTDNHVGAQNDSTVRSFTIGESSTLTFFPNSILQQFPNLRYLLLYSGGLTALNPGDFAGCSSIAVMHVKYTTISRIPAGLFDDCHDLRILDISNNLISEIDDDAFSTMVELLEIELDNNRLERIQQNLFRNLVNLQDLFLSENRIAVIDDGAFSSLQNLIIFYMRGNNISEIRPEMFGTEISLVTFILSENRLTSVPRLPTRAPELKYIFLVNNLIEEINDGDFTFSYSNITYIDLSHNRLTRLSSAPFAILASLDYLVLSHNRIEAIDHELFDRVPTLYTFYMEHNICADVRFNNIRSVDQFGTIESSLDRCYYHFLDAPNSHTCTFLIVEGFYVCEVSDVTFRTFRDKFNLIGEHLEDMSNANVTGLRILGGNIVRVPPTIFITFPNLRSLTITNAGLSVIDANTFEQCGRVVNLDLSGNRIRRLVQRSFQNCNSVESQLSFESLLNLI